MKSIELPDGSKETVALWQLDAEYGLMDITEVGEPHFVPLEVTKLHMPENKTDSARRFRPYVGLKLPADLALRIGKREITAALYQTSKDKKRKYLRSAHVRAIGPSSRTSRSTRRCEATPSRSTG